MLKKSLSPLAIALAALIVPAASHADEGDAAAAAASHAAQADVDSPATEISLSSKYAAKAHLLPLFLGILQGEFEFGVSDAMTVGPKVGFGIRPILFNSLDSFRHIELGGIMHIFMQNSRVETGLAARLESGLTFTSLNLDEQSLRTDLNAVNLQAGGSYQIVTSPATGGVVQVGGGLRYSYYFKRENLGELTNKYTFLSNMLSNGIMPSLVLSAGLVF